MTRDKMLTLKAKTAQENTARKTAAIVLSEIQSLISSLFFVSPKKKNSMCRYYGHIIQGHWDGDKPHCGDCGALINGPEELRKAQAKA